MKLTPPPGGWHSYPPVQIPARAEHWTCGEMDRGSLYPGLWRIEVAPGAALVAYAPNRDRAEQIVREHNRLNTAVVPAPTPSTPEAPAP